MCTNSPQVLESCCIISLYVYILMYCKHAQVTKSKEKKTKDLKQSIPQIPSLSICMRMLVIKSNLFVFICLYTTDCLSAFILGCDTNICQPLKGLLGQALWILE